MGIVNGWRSSACVLLVLWSTQAPGETANNAVAAEDDVPTIPLAPSTVQSTDVIVPDTAPAQLDDVVVSGERIERLIVQTTSSVRVIDGETIDDSTMEDLYDAFTRTANVNTAQNNNGRTGGFAIRGIADSGVGNESFGSSAGLASIVVDDVVLGGAGHRAGPLDFWDVEAVEIFRGPQSTNQGRNALAGAVIMRTRRPTEGFDLRGRVRFAEDGGEQQAIAIGGGLPGPFTARIAAQHEQSDGSVTNITRHEHADARERDNVRFKLGFQPASLPDFSALLTLTASHDDRGQPRLSGDPYRRESVANDPEKYEAETRLGSLRLNYFLSDAWELTSITALSETSLDQYQDYYGSAEEDGTLNNFVEDRTRSQELRLSFGGVDLLGSPLRGVLGAYGSRIDSERDTYVIDGAVAIAYLDGQTEIVDRQTTWALFGETEWQFASHWSLIAGGRYDHQDIDFDYFSNYDIALSPDDPLGVGDVLGDLLGPTFGLPADSEGQGRMTSAVFLPKLGLRYDGERDWSAGLTLQRAYRAGALSVNFARGSFHEVDPEYTWTTELSLRAEWLERRLRTQANVYYTDWRDQQVVVQLSDDPNDTQTENVGQSALYGVELEIDWRFTPSLSGFVSAGYAKTRFDEFSVTQYDSEAGEYVDVSYAGNRFPGAAPKQAALGIRYAPDNLGAYAQLDFSYTDGSYRLADNDPAQQSDAYALLNGKIGWRWAHGDLYLSGRNLLDRGYVTQRAFDFSMVGEPRIVSVSLDLRF